MTQEDLDLIYKKDKPSEEQMKQLHKYCPDNRPLTQLYQDLNKLMEEQL